MRQVCLTGGTQWLKFRKDPTRDRKGRAIHKGLPHYNSAEDPEQAAPQDYKDMSASGILK